MKVQASTLIFLLSIRLSTLTCFSILLVLVTLAKKEFLCMCKSWRGHESP